MRMCLQNRWTFWSLGASYTHTYTHMYIFAFRLIRLSHCSYSNHHLSSSSVCVGLCVCTTSYRIEFLTYMLHKWHLYELASSIYVHQIVSIYAKFGGNFCIWHILCINTWRRSCIWLCFGIFIEKMLGLLTHLTCWLCELHLECAAIF